MDDFEFCAAADFNGSFYENFRSDLLERSAEAARCVMNARNLPEDAKIFTCDFSDERIRKIYEGFMRQAEAESQQPRYGYSLGYLIQMTNSPEGISKPVTIVTKDACITLVFCNHGYSVVALLPMGKGAPALINILQEYLSDHGFLLGLKKVYEPEALEYLKMGFNKVPEHKWFHPDDFTDDRLPEVAISVQDFSNVVSLQEIRGNFDKRLHDTLQRNSPSLAYEYIAKDRYLQMLKKDYQKYIKVPIHKLKIGLEKQHDMFQSLHPFLDLKILSGRELLSRKEDLLCFINRSPHAKSHKCLVENIELLRSPVAIVIESIDGGLNQIPKGIFACTLAESLPSGKAYASLIQQEVGKDDEMRLILKNLNPNLPESFSKLLMNYMLTTGMKRASKLTGQQIECYNLGGSEVEGLDHFKRYLGPHTTIQALFMDKLHNS